MKNYFLLTTAGILLTVPLFSYAMDASSSSQDAKPTQISTEEDTVRNTFTLCSQDAIEKRDTSIALSRSDYNIAMNAALLERKNTEKLAVSNDSETPKKAALKVSVENYKNKTKLAQNNLTQARKLAWQTFENDIKKCRDERKDDVATFKENVTETRMEKNDELDVKESKTLKEAFKEKLENLKSLFN